MSRSNFYFNVNFKGRGFQGFKIASKFKVNFSNLNFSLFPHQIQVNFLSNRQHHTYIHTRTHVQHLIELVLLTYIHIPAVRTSIPSTNNNNFTTSTLPDIKAYDRGVVPFLSTLPINHNPNTFTFALHPYKRNDAHQDMVYGTVRSSIYSSIR